MSDPAASHVSDPAPGQWTAADRRPGWVFYTLLASFAASCAAGFLLPLDLPQPPVATKAAALGIVILGTLVAVSLHEWANAFMAYRGGDTSVVGKGYLTLDFRRYSDPLLSIGMPVLFLLLGALPLPGGAVTMRNASQGVRPSLPRGHACRERRP